MGFDAEAAGPPLQVDLRSWAGSIDDELLPELVTARGERKDEVAASLAGMLHELRRERVETFRFRDLLDPLKDGVRERWAAILAGDDEIETARDEDAAARAWLARPGKGYEEKERFRALVSCVLEHQEVDSPVGVEIEQGRDVGVEQG